MTHHKPLSGYRVIEMSHMVMGPTAGMFLAFLGAEVIKVEPPTGDKTRALTGMGAGFYPTFNRGKKSVTLDVKDPADLATLHTLLATADVFIENFRDQTLDRLGLSAATLRAAHPRLIVASCKGFLSGPYEERAAMDEVVQMMTGLAYMTGPTGRPLRVGSSANDIMGGLMAALGVMGALLSRQATGEGAEVRTGLFENCLLLVAQHMVQFDLEGTEAPPMPERTFSWPVYDLFTTRDARQVFVGAATDGQWDKLCRCLDLDHLLDDPTLADRPALIAARDTTLPQIAERIGARDFADVIALMERDGLLFAPVARPVEMYDDPHVNRPGGLMTSLMNGQSFRAPGLPFELDGTAPAPETTDIAGIGAHNDEILSPLRAGRSKKARA